MNTLLNVKGKLSSEKVYPVFVRAAEDTDRSAQRAAQIASLIDLSMEDDSWRHFLSHVSFHDVYAVAKSTRISLTLSLKSSTATAPVVCPNGR